ncbi:transglycosylase SLT domain-containing protein [Nocardioides sp. SOB77]|uniref:Transglycosylase SLT domain-containing protein n=1 Tax=Nocardioides oceani TaxID=3058369 RepID=A0ABT8FFV0_9ACTN|nr:transglycosylase SLT domain-containing protein [Nocardioides oceani]MDN4173557.1 transglycosylase SLT domain-containing protein [Nocardioides oceani]
MSVTAVTSRVAEIQGVLSQLGAPRAPGSALAAGSFRTAMDGALATALAPAGAPAAAASPGGARVVAEAEKYLGVPYVWGGTDPANGLDCSGLVQLVYRNLGIDLPRVSRDQAQAGRPVASLAEAQPGDLLAFNSPVSHIAIYVGDGKMIEAPRPGLSVRVTEVSGDLTAIRRVLPESAPTVSGRASAPVSAVPYADLFNRAAATYGVDAGLLAAIAKQESGYRPDAVSPVGAQGLMQLMPATARGLGVSDSFDPAQAVDGAARLVRDLLDRFGRTDLALAAYNAGPGAVLRYGGIPPYPETQNYVRSVLATVGGTP